MVKKGIEETISKLYGFWCLPFFLLFVVDVILCGAREVGGHLVRRWGSNVPALLLFSYVF